MKTLTMGSLFDGIGGFPLAAVHNGIVPVWASEIETFPIEVTRLRFPIWHMWATLQSLTEQSCRRWTSPAVARPVRTYLWPETVPVSPVNAPVFLWNRFES